MPPPLSRPPPLPFSHTKKTQPTTLHKGAKDPLPFLTPLGGVGGGGEGVGVPFTLRREKGHVEGEGEEAEQLQPFPLVVPPRYSLPPAHMSSATLPASSGPH